MLTSSRFPLALTALLAISVASSCSSDRRGGGGIRKPKDAGPDTGVTDTGNPVDSGTGEDGGPNPDGGPGNDGGLPQNDGGPPQNDGGLGNDGGPQPGECSVNGDCTQIATNPFCLRIDQTTGSLVQCSGQADCSCWQGCEPFVAVDQSGCPRPAEACATAGAMSPTPGVCAPDQGGGTQSQACTATFNGVDPNTNWAGDSCNISQNFRCHGSDSMDPTGSCARICDTNNGSLCTSLDAQSQCIAFPMTTQGVCLRPTTDVGVACMNDSECQGGYCAPELGNQCSHRCGVTFACPQSDALCVFTTDGQVPPICALTCTLGTVGDTACAQVNTGLICEDIGVALCVPRCDNTTNPCTAPATCNANGHCI